MKKLLLRFLALFFPWAVFLIEDNPGGAIFALFLQATLIGWLPSTIWAWQTASKIIARDKMLKKRKVDAANDKVNQE